jgi:hypothetical protein
MSISLSLILYPLTLRHPAFAMAVLAALQKEPAQDRIGHFIDHWDLLRFLVAIKNLKGDHHLKKIKGVKRMIDDWAELRHRLSHEFFDLKSDGFANRQLAPYITWAAEGLSQVNSLPKDSPRARDICQKLNQLEGCLQVSQVPSVYLAETKTM